MIFKITEYIRSIYRVVYDTLLVRVASVVGRTHSTFSLQNYKKYFTYTSARELFYKKNA